jgi:hypothetical protein
VRFSLGVVALLAALVRMVQQQEKGILAIND